MQPSDWLIFTEFAKALAAASAREILPYFRRDNAVDVKAGEVWDPVTEADRAGERIMRAMIEERFPGHGILGEEYGTKDSSSGFTWVLDPVDGTRAFICGMPTWATLIGLSYEGVPKVGIMNQPFVDEMFVGNPEGAWSLHQGSIRALRTSPPRPLSQAILTTTAPELYRSDEEKQVLKRLSRAVRLTRFGGDAYFFCLMAAGRIDIAMDAHMQPYDIAPLMPIILGAGGHVSTWDRKDAAGGGNIVSAGSDEMLEAALAVIQP